MELVKAPESSKYAVNRFLDEKQGRVAIAENQKMLFLILKADFYRKRVFHCRKR